MDFCEIPKNIKDRSALGENKLLSLWRSAWEMRYREGVFAEAGLWQGGSLYVLAAASAATDIDTATKIVYGFDSFEGLPPARVEDGVEPGSGAGGFSVPLELVQCFVSPFGDRIKLVKGFFRDTLNDKCIAADEVFALVHVDVDYYESYQQCLEFFTPRMIDGGIMIFDEYDFPFAPGARKAIEEYFGVEYIKHHTLYCMAEQLTMRVVK